EQSADEEISGNHEGNASVVDSAQVENGDDEKNGEAERNGMCLQGRNGGDEGADSRGDAYGGGEDVVGKQGRGGEKSGENAKIGASDGVGAASRGIGSDGLQVGEIDDDEQGDDGGADRDDVLHTEKAERDEQGESGFGAVRGGAEGVEAEDGDAGDGANLLGALVRGFQGLANDQVDKIHDVRMTRNCEGSIWWEMGEKVNRREEVKIEVRKQYGKEVMKRQRTSLIAGLSQKEQRELL